MTDRGGHDEDESNDSGLTKVCPTLSPDFYINVLLIKPDALSTDAFPRRR